MDEKKKKCFEELTPEEQAELIKLYREESDNRKALEELRTNIETYKQDFGKMAWKTGFTELDRKLDGGFMGEQLIFLGAISSLGKTSFALQIATQIAESGRDVLIFSLEMSKDELNAKTISRYTHILAEKEFTPPDPDRKKARQKSRLTTRDILKGDVDNMAATGEGSDEKGKLFLEAYEATEKIIPHTYIFVGENDVDVDKVRESVEIHIEAKKKKSYPFVILDYLQILQASDNAKTSDKRLLTDYDVTRLKILARDFHIPVLVISAFNRMSYLDPVSMGSFRESSGIEYSSDILLAMQYEGMEYIKNGKRYETKQEHDNRVRDLLDDMDKKGSDGLPLPIELKILKNRNGTKGSLFFDFLPAYNYYREYKGKPRYVPPSEKYDLNNLELNEVPEEKKSKSLGKV